MTEGVYIKGNSVYLTYEWLEAHNISYDSIRNWVKRKINKPLVHEGRSYIKYSEIPTPSLKKLPPENVIRSAENKASKKRFDNYITDLCYSKLYYSYEYCWTPFRSLYEEMGFNIEKSTSYAKDHALWKRMIELRDGTGEDKCRHSPGVVYAAYKRIHLDGYAYAYMCAAYRIIREKGVPAFLVKHISHKGNAHAKKFGKEHEKFVLDWVSSGKAYSAVTIHDELYTYCEQNSLPIPGYTWVKYCVAKYKKLAERERYGDSIYKSETEPYAGIIKALNPNTAWQCDGWRLPFHMKGYETLNFYGVMDEHSGYIIAYDIAPTENTESILRALSRAVKTTGCLPHEIKTDNHSFNQTKEADYLKAHTDKLGMTWTIDSNPRRKGVIERNLGVFGEKFMKKYAGYIGSGIKSKSKDAHVSQEEKDKYHKADTWITKDEIIYYVAECVQAYNNYVAKKDLGKVKSRRELYENPDQPHKIPVSYENALRLFIRESEYKVQRGQINIKRELELHEYQLNSELGFKYNSKHLRVRYESFDEIYLFDMDTDECLGSVKPKRMAHGAKADQTETDIEILNQNKGRLKGYENQRYKAQQSLDPDAPHHVNRIVGRKIEIEKLERDSELQRDFLEHGGNIDLLIKRNNVNENNSLKPKDKKSNPLTKKHTIRKVSIPAVPEDEPSRMLRKDQPFTDPTVKIRKYSINNTDN